MHHASHNKHHLQNQPPAVPADVWSWKTCQSALTVWRKRKLIHHKRRCISSIEYSTWSSNLWELSTICYGEIWLFWNSQGEISSLDFHFWYWSLFQQDYTSPLKPDFFHSACSRKWSGSHWKKMKQKKTKTLYLVFRHLSLLVKWWYTFHGKLFQRRDRRRNQQRQCKLWHYRIWKFCRYHYGLTR